MSATVPPVSDLARVELQLRKHRALGATSRKIAAELFMAEPVVLQHLKSLTADGKAEEFTDRGFGEHWRLIRRD